MAPPVSHRPRTEGVVRTLVVIPTYNEARNIEWLARAVLQQGDRIDLLFVDDSSPDGTGEVADRLARQSSRVSVIHRPGKLGLGSAYIEGFRYALSHGYDLVMEMDADHSHDPRAIPDLLRAVEGCDLALGSRYVDGISVVNWSPGRVLLSYLSNLYARKVTGLPCHDVTTGFRCYRRKVLESLDLDRIGSNGYAFQIEMAYRTHQLRFRIAEVPIIFYGRFSGTSKMSRWIVWEAAFMVWRLRFSPAPKAR